MKNPNENGARFTIIAAEVFMTLTAAVTLFLYTQGVDHLVRSTINAMPILLVSIISGTAIGYGLLQLFVRTDIGKCDLLGFQKVFPYWFVYAPISVIAFIGFYVNLKLGDVVTQQLGAVVRASDYSYLSGEYLLDVDLDNRQQQVGVPKLHRIVYAEGDSVILTVVKGYFGYDVLRIASQTHPANALN